MRITIRFRYKPFGSENDVQSLPTTSGCMAVTATGEEPSWGIETNGETLRLRRIFVAHAEGVQGSTARGLAVLVAANGGETMFTSHSVSRACLIRKLLLPILCLGALRLMRAATAAAEEGREDERKETEYLRRLAEKYKEQHSDSMGQVRADLLRQGMDHAAQMPTARYVGGPAATGQPP